MGIKSDIISKIDTDLASTSDILATEHRGVLHGTNNSLVDNFYGLKTGDINASTNVVTEDNANKEYTVSTIKQGFAVEINGTLVNNTAATTGIDTIWFSITTTEYEQQGSSKRFITGHSASTGEPIRFVLFNNEFKSLDPIAVGESVRFTLTYNTQN